MTLTPRAPTSLDPRARLCLEALAAASAGSLISLCGAVGLAYYHDYRATADVDAWWSESANTTQRHRVIEILLEALRPHGPTRVRSWGDVVSVELEQEGRAVFSFQIAGRSARLRDPLPAPWPETLLLDHFDDLLASKMEALVVRGAPRDFRDVHELCAAGLVTPGRVWELWAQRRTAAGEEADRARAARAVRVHLERIERARPLESIRDGPDRDRAGAVRVWVREVLVRGLV